jgi:hypothetical protein
MLSGCRELMQIALVPRVEDPRQWIAIAVKSVCDAKANWVIHFEECFRCASEGDFQLEWGEVKKDAAEFLKVNR